MSDTASTPILSPSHRKMLESESAITPEVIAERGYRTIVSPNELLGLWFESYQCRVPGLLMPIQHIDLNVLKTNPDAITYQYRPDNPREDANGKIVKYDMPSKSKMCLDLPRRCQSALADPRVDLWVTEGIKKADAAASKGLCCVALLGVWGWDVADWSHINLKRRQVYVCFDSDVMIKKEVAEALRRLKQFLLSKGAKVTPIYLPSQNGEKVGLDDYFSTGGSVDELNTFTKKKSKKESDVIESKPGKRFRTELGNAERFIDQHGDIVRFCGQTGAWYHWTGSYWNETDTSLGPIFTKAKQTVRNIYIEAAHADSDTNTNELASWAKLSERRSALTNMISLAEKDHSITINPAQLDADPMLLSCANGTIELSTGQLREARQADLMTKQIPIRFDPNATCPIFQAFLERALPDETVRTFIQRAVGYSLTGRTGEKALFFLYGHIGNNGKSTFLEILGKLMGDYWYKARVETLLEKKNQGIPSDIAALFGRRLVTTSEVGERQRLNVELVKDMTGQDTLNARRLYKEEFNFSPTFKLWMYGNNRPTVPDGGDAMWKRLKLIPFEVSIPDAEIDRSLPQKLALELSGILNWAVQGCLEWQRDGLGEPTAVQEATQEYRSDQDLLGQFLADCCDIDSTAEVKAKDLYSAYLDWCKEVGDARPLSQVMLGRILPGRGFRKRDVTNIRTWCGLKVKPKFVLKTDTDVK